MNLIYHINNFHKLCIVQCFNRYGTRSVVSSQTSNKLTARSEVCLRPMRSKGEEVAKENPPPPLPIQNLLHDTGVKSSAACSLSLGGSGGIIVLFD